MVNYLLKQIWWIIPTLWFISSAVFVLLKLIPGEATFLQEEESGVNSASRSAIYRQYLERTGQNLPLFYVSFRSAAEPDTLKSILPISEQQFLRSMALTYGNWPLVAEFYTHLLKLKAISKKQSDPQLRSYYQKQLTKLFEARDATTLQHILSAIEQTHQRSTTNPAILAVCEATRQSFTQLQQNKTPYTKYIPVFNWHGGHNQYHQSLRNVVKGDLGISLRDGRLVHSILAEAIGNTFLLSLCSLLMIFTIAILLNFLLIHEDYSWLRKPVLHTVYVLDTIPLFLLASLLIILLASNQYLSLFPVYGLGTISEEATWLEKISIRLYHLAIPGICLTVSSIPYVISQLNAAMTEVKQADYIQTARAKGIAEWKIVRQHIFKNALLPLITLFSGFIPALLGGAVVIEVIFAIPGMGRLLVDSVLARDYPVVLGIVLVMAFAKMAAHSIADVLYYLADPRIRFS
ncbi:ABC transporter permease [Rhodocytophaga aerolata]|uniref:ABC transporter permease n=1 Tax=Rhodocytophaga aerolata TaxID=455078 RepID=A0ABT8RG52_9BACT|nr:ABC transporter permease [Rhodocytophaga aerolata]MDO1450324.1 ABC transporter permease [Rhodocytophaga aerolata]